MTTIVEPLEKHARYRGVYKPNDTFWGIGIENETYLQLSEGVVKPAECLLLNRGRERYSVEYWSTYKTTTVNTILGAWIDSLPDKGRTTVNFPLLMNAHAFISTDLYGEPKTTYSKNPAPNPKYAGKSLYEILAEKDMTTFKDGKDVWWTFDGDTVEFMTQHFYKAKMEDVVDELLAAKARFLNAIQRCLNATPGKEGRISYPLRNHGFAVYTTNKDNIGVFNNGTYHFNITLPTKLDADAKIADYELFEIQHRNTARLFQWLSPFLIAKYGSGDVFNYYFGDKRFPAGTQRCAASRYISVANYDTEKMPCGKILMVPYSYVEDRWYEKIYDISGCMAYNRLPNMGLDINYNKYWNHGLEFRIFDWFPEIHLTEVLRLLIWMCDESLLYKTVEDPRYNIHFNACLARVILEGGNAILTHDEGALFSKIFNVSLSTPLTCLNALTIIFNSWKGRWNRSDHSCTSYMIRNPLP